MERKSPFLIFALALFLPSPLALFVALFGAAVAVVTIVIVAGHIEFTKCPSESIMPPHICLK